MPAVSEGELQKFLYGKNRKKLMEKLSLLFVVGGLILFLLTCPQAQAVVTEIDTQTRYYLDTQINNYRAGGAGASLFKKFYEAQIGVTDVFLYKQYADAEGTLTGYFGIRVYKRDANATETQLTSAVSAIVHDTDNSGFGYLLDAYWTPSNTTLKETDVIVIRLYCSTDNSTWSQFTTPTYSNWNTESLLAVKLISSAWHCYYYVSVLWDGANTELDFFELQFGGVSEVQSRIENIQLEKEVSAEATSDEYHLEGFFMGALLAGSAGLVGMIITARKHS